MNVLSLFSGIGGLELGLEVAEHIGRLIGAADTAERAA